MRIQGKILSIGAALQGALGGFGNGTVDLGSLDGASEASKCPTIAQFGELFSALWDVDEEASAVVKAALGRDHSLESVVYPTYVGIATFGGDCEPPKMYGADVMLMRSYPHLVRVVLETAMEGNLRSLIREEADQFHLAPAIRILSGIKPSVQETLKIAPERAEVGQELEEGPATVPAGFAPTPAHDAEVVVEYLVSMSQVADVLALAKGEAQSVRFIKRSRAGNSQATLTYFEFTGGVGSESGTVAQGETGFAQRVAAKLLAKAQEWALQLSVNECQSVEGGVHEQCHATPQPGMYPWIFVNELKAVEKALGYYGVDSKVTQREVAAEIFGPQQGDDQSEGLLSVKGFPVTHLGEWEGSVSRGIPAQYWWCESQASQSASPTSGATTIRSAIEPECFWRIALPKDLDNDLGAWDDALDDEEMEMIEGFEDELTGELDPNEEEEHNELGESLFRKLAAEIEEARMHRNQEREGVTRGQGLDAEQNIGADAGAEDADVRIEN